MGRGAQPPLGSRATRMVLATIPSAAPLAVAARPVGRIVPSSLDLPHHHVPSPEIAGGEIERAAVLLRARWEQLARSQQCAAR